MFDVDYLKQLAVFRPRMAFCLARYRRIPASFPLRVTFRSTAPNTGTLSDTLAPFGTPNGRRRIGCDFCVTQKPAYTVHRPDAFQGSIFRGDSDVKNTIIPYIDVRFTLEGCPELLLNSEFQAIETVCRPAPVAEIECEPWVIPAIASVQGEFRLTRTLADEEIPYIVEVAFNGFVLDGCRDYARDVPQETIAAFLREKLSVDVSGLLGEI